MDIHGKANEFDGLEKRGLMLSSLPQSMDPTPPATTQGREVDLSEGITDEHRNGSITAIGIVLGFSLTFLSSWMHGPEPWDFTAFLILVALASGIALQIISLHRLLILPQSPGLRHSLTAHNRAATLFLWGTALVSAGFFLWILISMVHDLRTREASGKAPTHDNRIDQAVTTPCAGGGSSTDEDPRESLQHIDDK